ncbi:MAG: DUF3540 domain-containing protein [Sandaracinaceae bacterium]
MVRETAARMEAGEKARATAAEAGDPLATIRAKLAEAGVDLDAVIEENEARSEGLGTPDIGKLREAFETFGGEVPEGFENLEAALETLLAEPEPLPQNEEPPRDRRAELQDAHRRGVPLVGVSASVHDDVLVVRGADGELPFSHDARTGKSQIVSRALTIQADSVGIQGRDVTISAEQRIAMSVGAQCLSLCRAETRLEGQRLTTKLEEGRFSIREIVLGANKIEAGAKAVRQVYDVVERRAERVVERTRDPFREVEGVDQTRSGRIRLVAKKAFSLLTETASMRAEDDFAIVAEKIELG